jgi:hypothetical protein
VEERFKTVTLKYEYKLDKEGRLSEGTTTNCSLDLAKFVPFSGCIGDVLINVLFTELPSVDVNERRGQYSGGCCRRRCV